MQDDSAGSSSAIADTPASPPAAGPGSATAEQDTWLQSTLGLHVGNYQPSPANEEQPQGSLLHIAKSGLQTLTGLASTVVSAATQLVTGSAPAAPLAPVPRAELGEIQTTRAAALLQKMPAADQTKVKALLDKATPAEKKYLQKALASAHSATELDTFYKSIAGKDEAWLNQNLHVTGQSDGKGIKQQWHDSCAPTTIQAMKAELDPVYALQLRQQNPNLTEADDSNARAKNPTLADEQKKILTDNQGIAVARDATGGAGMKVAKALNDQKATTGLDFAYIAVTADTMDTALNDIDASIQKGLPVPLALGNDTGGHAVLVTGMDPGPPRRYSIHDPWDGKIVTVTDKQIKDGTFNIANWTKVKAMYKPSATPAAP